MERTISPLQVTFFGATDVGLVRRVNQDVWYGNTEQNIFLVADGMGGHKAGEVAAETAMKHTVAYLTSHPNKSLQLVEEAICFANRKVYELSIAKSEYAGMGTTICLLAILDKIFIGHVGDSRIYRFRKKLERLTEDHSLAQELMNIDGESHDTKYLPVKNVLTRAIGTYPTVSPSIQSFDYESEDLFLLCSDGLTNYVSDEQISKILSKKNSLSNSGESLIRLAKQQGGGDNITVVLVQITVL